MKYTGIKEINIDQYTGKFIKSADCIENYSAPSGNARPQARK
jgi:hypothetical protein